MNIGTTNNKNNANIDLLLDGFNLTGGLLALTALKAGINVAIRLNQKPEIGYQPELSFFYPNNFKHSLSALSNYRFLLKCSSLFPHLFFPQRILYFKSTGEINTKFNNTIDKLLGRDRESASFPIVTAKYGDYNEISGFFPKGALVYEYRFDRNRAIIDLLMLCKSRGANLVAPDQPVATKQTIKLSPYPYDSFSIELSDFTWPMKNSIRIEHIDFNLTFQPLGNGTLVHIYFNEQADKQQIIEQKLPDIFKDLNIPESAYSYIYLNNIAEQAVNRKVNSNQAITDPHLGQIRNTTNQIVKNASELTGKRLSLKHTLKSLAGEPMTFEQFRIIQTECDKQFDMAKQTGISYHHFIHLFYRYRHHIDAMIENAYEMMEWERDPEIIWNHIEKEFLVNDLEIIFGAQNKKE